MWKKIKEFFEKKSVKIVEAALIAVASIGLTIGGIKATEVVPQVTTVAVGVLTAVEAIVTLIQGLTTKKGE